MQTPRLQSIIHFFFSKHILPISHICLLLLVGVCFHPTEHVQSVFVGVCLGSVNMTVIFHKILNLMANLFVDVCWHCLCGVNWPLKAHTDFDLD